ncbi:MAG: hypothetical protein AAB518_02295 [Patescibacteria group bacterium]
MFVEIEYFKTFAEVAILYGRHGGPVLKVFSRTEYGKKYKVKATAFADYIAKSNGGLRVQYSGSDHPLGRPDRDWKAQRRIQWN